MKKTIGSKTFDTINYAFLAIYAAIAIIPFIYILVASLTPPELLLKKSFILIPEKISFDAYRYIFSTDTIPKSLLVSAFVTVFGTAVNIIVTVLMAYPLAHKDIMGRKFIMLMITFTLMFSGGMVPTYIIVQKLGLIDNLLSLILPNAMSAFSLIIFKNYFQELPKELEESARIDGCNDLKILLQIILPVSKPLIATFVIMFGVANWNSWFNAVLYINDPGKWPIQVILRQMITASAGVGSAESMAEGLVIPAEVVRMCTIVIATMPILCIYPFLQKYFTKGILLGSVKG